MNPPTHQDLEASLIDMGFHFGMGLCIALSQRNLPGFEQDARTRRIAFKFAAWDAKRRGTFPLFQQGAKAATKAMIHNSKNR